jgi:hypothetical protein
MNARPGDPEAQLTFFRQWIKYRMSVKPPPVKPPPVQPPPVQPPLVQPPPAQTPPTQQPPPAQTLPAQPPPAQPPIAKYAAGDALLQVRGSKIAPVMRTADDRVAYNVMFRRGVIHGEGSNMNALLAPGAVFPTEECRVAFKLFVAPGFPWGTDMKAVGGKLIGFEIGTGKASGGNYTSTGSTLRITWSYHGGVGPYFYPQVREGQSKATTGKNIDWAALDQHKSVQDVSYIATGIHMFHPKDKKRVESWELRLREGVWNDVQLYVKLNTPGKYDGIGEIVVNGVARRNAAMRYRYDAAKINGVRIHPFFGGGSQDYAPTRDAQLLYSDFTFSRA